MTRQWALLAAVSVIALPISVSAMGRMGLGMPLGAMNGGLRSGITSRSIATLGDLTLTGVYPRIFTPNGDGFNDKVGFHFDNPEDLPVSGTIYDLRGAKVVDLTPSADVLLWNGQDSTGRTVPSGIYLYQLSYQGHSATGTVVVAR